MTDTIFKRETWEEHCKRFKPGFRFSVQQASRTSKPRKYTIVFELDNECRPIRVGGVKPTFNTMEMVNRIVARRYGGVVT